MIIYLELFWAFLMINLLGYGGGPACLPLIQREVVDVYGWMTEIEFMEMLAAANALPGPIATKIAGFVGFEQAGFLGAFLALFATIVPSILLMIGLMGFLLKYKDAPQVKKLSLYVRPTIAALLGTIVLQNISISVVNIGFVHLFLLGGFSFLMLERFKLHPSLVIGGAMVYGAFFL